MTLLHLDNLSFYRDKTQKPILNQISYTIQPGDFVILLGSNGSGKSTLLKLLYRHHQVQSGEIYLHGKSVKHYQTREFNSQVAVFTQNCDHSLFSSLTVYENYSLIKNQKSLCITSSHLNEKKQLQNYIFDFNANLINKLDTPIHQLSGGEKQALALAFCLLQPPALLLLDEHTSALDPKTSEQIMQLTLKKIHEHRITCVLTTHDLDIALRYGNRILMLNNGMIHKIFDEKDKPHLTKEQLIHYYSVLT